MIYDVCIVGSGPGGGIATYVLAKAGLKIALVEAGPRLRAGIDYNAHGAPYANLEKRLSEGHRNPISSVWNDHAERNHFTPVGDNPGHGMLKALGGARFAGRDTAFVLDRLISNAGPSLTRKSLPTTPRQSG